MRRETYFALAMLVSLAMWFAAFAAFAANGTAEADYRDAWCSAEGGQAEVTLADRSRADCLTDTHAVEVERAAKWKESIGQALWYALQTNLDAGVVLIIEDEGDLSYWYRLNSVIETYSLPITTWMTGPGARVAAHTHLFGNASITPALLAQPAVARNTGSRSPSPEPRRVSTVVIRPVSYDPLPTFSWFTSAAGDR